MRRSLLRRILRASRGAAGGSSASPAPTPAPVWSSSASPSVAEDQTAVVTLVASDTSSYSIIGGADQALFALAGSALSFASLRDYESPSDDDEDGVYEVDVRATGAGGTTDQSISATLTDVADIAPTITSAASADVVDGETAVLTVTATGTGTMTYSIIGGADADLFSIDGSSGALTFGDAPDYASPGDVGANNVYNVDVRATSDFGTDDQSIAVTVTEAVVWPVSASVTGFSALSSTSQSMPALRTPVADAKFAVTSFTRVSDDSEIKPASGTFVNFGPFYPNRQHWNADGSKMIVTGYNTSGDGNYAAPYDRNFHVLNGTSPYAHVGPVVTSGGTGISNHWRWSNTDPDELIFLEFEGTALKAFDVSDMTISTIKDFSATYDRITDDFCGGVGDPSRDGRYWALAGRKSGTDWYVFCWDRTADSILCEIPVPVEPGSSYLPQVNMDWTGALILIWGTTGWTSGATSVDRGVSVWNKSGTYLRSINETGGSGATDIVGDHNSIGVDSSGNPVVIYFHSPDSGGSRYFVSRRLDVDQSGSPTQQCPDGMIFGAMYVTPFAFSVDGWCLISDYPRVDLNSTFDDYPLRAHCWAFKLDGSQTVYPICETRFSHVDFTLAYPYLMYPWPTPSRDMTKIMFKSSFDTDWSGGSGGVPTAFHAIIASA